MGAGLVMPVARVQSALGPTGGDSKPRCCMVEREFQRRAMALGAGWAVGLRRLPRPVRDALRNFEEATITYHETGDVFHHAKRLQRMADLVEAIMAYRLGLPRE